MIMYHNPKSENIFVLRKASSNALSKSGFKTLQIHWSLWLSIIFFQPQTTSLNHEESSTIKWQILLRKKQAECFKSFFNIGIQLTCGSRPNQIMPIYNPQMFSMFWETLLIWVFKNAILWIFNRSRIQSLLICFLFNTWPSTKQLINLD